MRCVRDACDQIFEATQDQFQVYDRLVVDLCARRLRIFAFADADPVGYLAETVANGVISCDHNCGCGIVVLAIDSQHLRQSTPSRFVGPRDCVVARET